MPLVEHRRKCSNDKKVVKILEFRPGDQLASWLARYGVAQGSIRPDKVPFYLLLVGDPSLISFEFGHQLDVEYAVGRLHFDSASDYAAYVNGVIEYETSANVATAREAVFWSPRHAFDPATQLSADRLVKPLADGIPATAEQPAEVGIAATSGFRFRKIWGTDARKEALLDVLRGKGSSNRPAFLFTASHGVGFKNDDPVQRDRQGALLCQDWRPFNPVAQEHCVAASDVTMDARVHGLVSLHFACYGAGTPAHDQFVHKPGQPPRQIAPKPFFARLLQRLLSHPNGSALACIGHVERAWGYSITTAGAGAQLLPFSNCMGRVLNGQPVGLALKDFNERYASLTVTLAGLLQQVGFGVKIPDAELASRWVERNDAEGYVLLGDPAVALRTKDMVV
jgi:hypothetical protein